MEVLTAERTAIQAPPEFHSSVRLGEANMPTTPLFEGARTPVVYPRPLNNHASQLD